MAAIFKVARAGGKTAWRAVIKHNNRTITSKTFKLKSNAKAWAARVEADQEFVTALGQSGATMLLRDLVREFLNQYKGKDPILPRRLGWWCDKMGEHKLSAITPELIEEYLNEYAAAPAERYAGIGPDMKSKTRSLNRPRAAATINRHRAALSSVFRFAKQRRYWSRNPLVDVPKLAENNKRDTYLSNKQLEDLLKACKASEWDRLHLLVRMAVTTGARRSELINLRWNEIDLVKREAYLQETKNGKPRVLTIPAFVVEEMKQFREVGNGLVFPGKRNPNKPRYFEAAWRNSLRRAGLKGFRFHDLRHSAASFLVRGGATLYETAQVLGHKSTVTTERYAHLSTEHKRDLTDRIMQEVFTNG